MIDDLSFLSGYPVRPWEEEHGMGLRTPAGVQLSFRALCPPREGVYRVKNLV